MTRVQVRTDDEVYRVDAVWLGPPKATFPWRARYSAYGVGLLVMIVVMFIQRRLGIDLGFFSIAWALLITVLITRFVSRRINDERPLLEWLTLFSHELRGPRARARTVGGALTTGHVRVRRDRPRAIGPAPAVALPRGREDDERVIRPKVRDEAADEGWGAWRDDDHDAVFEDDPRPGAAEPVDAPAATPASGPDSAPVSEPASAPSTPVTSSTHVTPDFADVGPSHARASRARHAQPRREPSREQPRREQPRREQARREQPARPARPRRTSRRASADAGFGPPSSAEVGAEKDLPSPRSSTREDTDTASTRARHGGAGRADRAGWPREDRSAAHRELPAPSPMSAAEVAAWTTPPRQAERAEPAVPVRARRGDLRQAQDAPGGTFGPRGARPDRKGG